MFGGFPFGDFFHGQGRPGGDSPEEVDNQKYYDLLGVDKNASCEEIKKKFRVLAKTQHPDKGGDPKKFAEMTQAAEVLSDPNKRRVYDSHGEAGINKGMHSNEGPQDLFDLLSGRGGKKQSQRKSQDVSHKISVSLLDLYNGCVKKLAINRSRNCPECKGEGGSKVETCSECRGRGMVKKLVQIGPGMYSQSAGPCNDCKGTGKSIDPKFRCKKCKGARTYQEKKVIEVNVDKGCPNHHRYTFYGESDEEPGLLPGDFVAIVEETEHPLFKRKKADLAMSKTISLKEALTGYCFEIDHLDGKKTIQSSHGDVVKPGDIRTIEELGMPVYMSPYMFGNLFIHFDVEFPAPGSLEVAQIEVILNSLPGEKMRPEGNTLTTISYDKSQITENPTSIHSDFKEEDEEDPRLAGGTRVQCAGNIF